MPFLSRVFILAAILGFLLPSAGLASYQLAVPEGTGMHPVEVPRWDRPTGLWGRSDHRTGARSRQPGNKVLLAAQTKAKKKG
jgi:hypothetical protein